MARVDNTGGSGFTTDNGTGLVVRTKLNQIVAALSTLNQGSGDPSIGVAAYVPHIDGNTLKIRNSANNAFVTLGDVSLTNFGHAGLSAANTFTSTNNFQEDVTFTGASANIIFDKSTDDLIFNDNAKAIFGTGSDGLEIFHDTSGTEQSVIKDSGTGQLLIQGENTIAFTNVAGSKNFLRLLNNGACELYENGTKRFETSTGGVSLTGGAAANITDVTQSSATITFDFASSCHHKVTLTQNATLAAPSNQAVGQSGSIFITQPSSGNYTVAYNSAFKFAGGTTPTASTSSNAVDRIDYVVFSSNVIHAVMSLDVKTGT